MTDEWLVKGKWSKNIYELKCKELAQMFRAAWHSYKNIFIDVGLAVKKIHSQGIFRAFLKGKWILSEG